jgi:hypothetical protein
MGELIALSITAGIILLYLLGWLTLIIIREIHLFKYQRAEIKRYQKQIDKSRGN